MNRLQQSLLVASLLLVTLLSSCKDQKQEEAPLATAPTEKEVEAPNSSDSKVPIYKFDEFEPLLNQDDGNVYVVNFWATWCKPCIKELPYFETIGEKYAEQNVKVLLVSIDFPKLLEKQVIPFIEKNELKSPVVLLDDTGANEWIPKVDESWSGAIPATVIYKGDQRKFFEQSFTLEELEKELNTFL
ncbi:TlpA family protein disulfide reductase [Gilvibacter sp.]|uniref:TlpA disulfide reductase family protein n=1 Tax=Gilvibacter sp. TaxID=2729997 RepID=UPI003F4A79DF